MANRTPAYRFTVLGRYRSRVAGNADHVTVRMSAGSPGHEVHCGTLTMTDPEWRALARVLDDGLGERLEIEDLDRRGAA